MAKEEDDDASLEAVETDISSLKKEVEHLEFQRMFNQEHDEANCFLEIQAGAGGTEAQDWASMLERMYIKFAERQGFKPEIVEETEGDVAGIKRLHDQNHRRLCLRLAQNRDRYSPLSSQEPVRLQRTPSYFFCFCVRRSRSRRFF